MRDLTIDEVEMVSGGVTVSAVLGAGAAIAAGGAFVLALPALAAVTGAAAIAYGGVAAVMGLGSAFTALYGC